MTQNRWADEAMVADAIAGLDPDGFVVRWLQYCTGKTDAPAAYHLGSALTLLSTVLPRALTVPGLVGRAVDPDAADGGGTAGGEPGNVFVMLVGRQATERKSTVVKFARAMLGAVDAIRDGDEPVSAEGFDKSVCDQPQQALLMEEMADFFAKTLERKDGNYASTLKTRSLRLYDRTPLRLRRSNSILSCPLPHVSILGGINPRLIVDYASRNDWQGGLMSRFIVLWARREREMDTPDPASDKFAWREMKQMLTIVASASPDSFGRCLGLSPHAKDLWSDWSTALDQSHKGVIDETTVGQRNRAPIHAVRIALLLAFGDMRGWPQIGIDNTGQHIVTGAGQPFFIGAQHMVAAMKIATASYISALLLAEYASDDADMMLRRQVYDAVGEDWTPIGAITRASRKLVHRLPGVFDTLVEEGLIEWATLDKHGVALHEKSKSSAPGGRKTIRRSSKLAAPTHYRRIAVAEEDGDVPLRQGVDEDSIVVNVPELVEGDYDPTDDPAWFPSDADIGDIGATVISPKGSQRATMPKRAARRTADPMAPIAPVRAPARALTDEEFAAVFPNGL